MQQLYYELSVLSKAVHFKNLSAAALHVGLSQPQLSRIIAKIEDELKIVLLDRSAKRKSGWTGVAFQLAEIFEKSIRRLELEMQGISNNQMVAELHIGTLEGLSDFALKTCRLCFEEVGVKKITLDIFDLNELEANFLSGNLDLIFTSKTPGRQKFKYLEELGFQKLEKIESNTNFAVLSTFEYGRANKKELEDYPHLFVSNSLAMRKSWLENHGGTGHVPTEAKKGRAKDAEPVLMIGSELLSPVLWENITAAIER
ncbi:LysR family transcriptional regulator [Bdellovibrio reynosensis]|uniref:LysR family transcriptional regulator n=1 Tax=Bdellovibrio reynosensis TaxID=2835041 RepID=A0ABY4C8S1_9BACT|nr:LysR family transcriptional regulator [Bdellovibrio reynosensis]UOF00026.1 LysR family transcriptional regulator [Bdellovibrio reynosensis]